jgi:AcrR family transcriptional regulator
MASSRNSTSRNVSARRPLPIPAGAQPGRRRSPLAARAVLQAALDLLDRRDVGYRGLTMQAVAVRSGVSKATLYRWWPNKAHLVLDAYRSKATRDVAAPVIGDLRTDLRSHLGSLAFALVNLESAATVTEITLAAAEDQSFGQLYRQTLLRERRQAVLDILIAGRARGQVRADVDLSVAVDAAFGAIHHRLLLTKEPIDGHFITVLAGLIVGGLST